MPPQNKPSSPKVQKLIDKLDVDGKQGARWKAIKAAVDAALLDANVPSISDSELAEVFYYLGGKIQSRSVI